MQIGFGQLTKSVVVMGLVGGSWAAAMAPGLAADLIASDGLAIAPIEEAEFADGTVRLPVSGKVSQAGLYFSEPIPTFISTEDRARDRVSNRIGD
ncbi:MAG: hypothetical protein AAFZ17_05350, partial [Cyanobacteria bacterium J06650_10]